MASPHVAGVAALMAQKCPDLTGPMAEQILEASAIPMLSGTQTILAGPAGPWVNVTWGADATGHGLVDAEAALSMTP